MDRYAAAQLPTTSTTSALLISRITGSINNNSNNNYSTSSPATIQPPYHIASIIGQTCFSLLIIIAALIGNSLIVASVWTSKKLRKPTNYVIVSLAISDILIAATIIPFRVHHLLNLMVWDLGPTVCKFWSFVDILCTTASTASVAVIAVDRFIALSYPFKYPQLMSARRCAIAIAIVWSFSLLLSLLSFTDFSSDAYITDKPACFKSDKNYYLFTTSLGLVTPLIILVIAYSLVFRVAFRQAVRIREHSNVQGSTSHASVQQQNGHSKSAGNAKRTAKTRLLIREIKATRTLMIVVGTFLICWMPFCILVLVIQHCPKCLTERVSPPGQQVIGIVFVYTLPRLNSALNPIIYSIFNREFRAVICLLCGKLTGFILPAHVLDCLSRSLAACCCTSSSTNNLACETEQNTTSNSICCGFLRTGSMESTSDGSATYDINSGYYTALTLAGCVSTSRSPSLFVFQKNDSYSYESSV